MEPTMGGSLDEAAIQEFSMDDPYADKMKRLEQTVLSGPGELASSIRQAAAVSGEVPEVMKIYIQKVARYAYKVTDQDVEVLRRADYTEDQIFELTVSAALGAGLVRLKAGLASLQRGEHDATPHR